jgi:hypothetical protein
MAQTTFKRVYSSALCALPKANGSTYFISSYNQKKYSTTNNENSTTNNENSATNNENSATNNENSATNMKIAPLI